MRNVVLLSSAGAALLLAGCDAWETAPPPAPPQPAPITAAPPAFEDNGCLSYLLLQRAAILEGSAQGDAAALDAPIAAWRARGAQSLSAEELAQYETSSVATRGDEGAEAIATRAAQCVTNAPSRAASQGQEQETGSESRNNSANP